MNSNSVNVAKFKAWLKSVDSYQRATALSIFVNTNTWDDDIDQLVIRIIQVDDDLTIRREAVRFITQRKDYRFKRVLEGALDDSDWKVRGDAYLALTEIDSDCLFNERISRFLLEEVHPYGRWCIENKAK